MLSHVWKRMAGAFQWRVLWLFHSKYILGVSGIVTDSQGRILLLKHRYWKHHSWGLPSGYTVRGETLSMALQREVREETGLEIQVGDIIQIKSGFRFRVEVSFRGLIAEGTPHVTSEEILDAQFFDVVSLPTDVLPSHRQLIHKALQGTERAGAPIHVNV